MRKRKRVRKVKEEGEKEEGIFEAEKSESELPVDDDFSERIAVRMKLGLRGVCLYCRVF